MYIANELDNKNVIIRAEIRSYIYVFDSTITSVLYTFYKVNSICIFHSVISDAKLDLEKKFSSLLCNSNHNYVMNMDSH